MYIFFNNKNSINYYGKNKKRIVKFYITLAKLSFHLARYVLISIYIYIKQYVCLFEMQANKNFNLYIQIYIFYILSFNEF
jgi:hypothetical protein